MFTAIRIKNQQYSIREGDIIKTNRLKYLKNQTVTFKHTILHFNYMQKQREKVMKDINITAQIVLHNKEIKKTIFKKKKRKNYRRKGGDKIFFTLLKIKNISKI